MAFSLLSGHFASKGAIVQWRTLLVAALLFMHSGTSCSNEIAPQGVHFTETQRQIADQVISVFENNTPVLQYGYVEALGDGRGITAGRAGFTSATGDMYTVVALYTQWVPDNSLRKYLPTLKILAQSSSSDTHKLAGLSAAWAKAAEDTRFRSAQDQVVDSLYYQPVVDISARVGVTQALSLLILYDTAIQHGIGQDPDGLPALIMRTKRALASVGVSEKQWATEFLRQRRITLNNASSLSTQAVWAESIGRVDTLQLLVDEGNVELLGGFVIDTWGTAFIVDVQLAD